MAVLLAAAGVAHAAPSGVDASAASAAQPEIAPVVIPEPGAAAATDSAAAPSVPADPDAALATAPEPEPKAAPWPPPPLLGLPDRDPARAAVDRAWRLPAQSLAERVARTQRTGLLLGLRELDGPARTLLLAGELGDASARAEHATVLAPSLPAAHAALAEARFAGGDVRGAASAVHAALGTLGRHLEARAWAVATGYELLALAAMLWATVFLALGAAASLPTLLHGLASSRLKLRGPAGLAALATVVMGIALVEGPAGAALGLGALAVASGGWSKRAASFVSVAAALAALHLGLERAAVGRVALAADPVGVAAHRVEAGLPTPADVGVLLRSAGDDPVAARALALHAKRSGDRAAAAQYFARALAAQPDAEAFNNAANVAFALGDNARAIALYEKSVQLEPSPIALFNLSQAYGRAIRLDEQDRTLARAQQIDAATVERLASRTGTGKDVFVTDAGFSAASVFARAEQSGLPKRWAAARRASVAPGWLGASLSAAAAVSAVILIAAVAAGGTLARIAGPRDFYADLARTLRSGVGDSEQRVAQLTRLRKQRANTERLLTLLAFTVPGAAGFRYGRPLAAWVASCAFASGIALLAGASSAPADPLALGALPALVATATGALLAALYVLSTALAFALRAEE
ncbi:MAG TPA: tetratricopeptide repeat protein [Myxococcota bacterium]|nr:tetratricopeptide repeat protein [Myxococcota bacterium]